MTVTPIMLAVFLNIEYIFNKCYPSMWIYNDIPGVMIVPVTIGSKVSTIMEGSGKWTGFVIDISDPPYCLMFFSPFIVAVNIQYSPIKQRDNKIGTKRGNSHWKNRDLQMKGTTKHMKFTKLTVNSVIKCTLDKEKFTNENKRTF